MANAEMTTWDQQLSDSILSYCAEVEARLAGVGDPAHGQWCATSGKFESCTIWADTSDISIGVAIELDGSIFEDRSIVCPYDDKRHINIVVLEATIRGLSLAVDWQVKRVRLMTDSKTVASWLREVIGNVRRTRTKGLHEVLVQRRLQIVADLVDTTGLVVSVEWVLTAENRADGLTLVPVAWVKHCKLLKDDGDVTVAAATATVDGPVQIERIIAAQSTEDEIQTLITQRSKTSPS